MTEQSMNPAITFSGKPIEKMSWVELQKEIQVQRAYARRMREIGRVADFNLEKRKKKIQAEYENLIKKYEDGKITEEEWKKQESIHKGKVTKCNHAEDVANFYHIHENTARSLMKACKDRQAYVTKPKQVKPSRRKPGYYRFGSRKLKILRPNRHKMHEERTRFAKWQNSLQTKGLGGLYDKERFIRICNDRGYSTDISIYAFVAETLGLKTEQAKVLVSKGKFTWGQILGMGAALEVSPKEFADTFMRGYFGEVTEGVFRATYKNIPDDYIDKSIFE